MKIQVQNENIENNILHVRDELRNLRETMDTFAKTSTSGQPNTGLIERVAELEVKMSKLWTLLIEKSPATNAEKLNKFGRVFQRRFNP